MNFDNLINQFLAPMQQSSTQSKNHEKNNINMGSLAASAALGGVAGYMANSSTGKRIGRQAMRVGRTAAGVGGLALIGGLAYKAYSSYQDKQNLGSNVRLPVDEWDVSSDEVKSGQVDETKLGLLIVRVMIAAALADGVLDEQEEARIFGQLNDSNLTQEEQNFLLSEMKSPLSVSELCQQCTSEEMAIQVFSAALLAIEVDTPQERKFIFDLKQQLNIDEELAKSIELELENIV